MPEEKVEHRVVKSVVALIGRTIFLQAVSGIALFLLGIFLDPGAIGTFIVVSSITRVFNLFTDMGLGAALVQKKADLDQKDLSTAFVIQEFFVLLVIAAGFILTPFISAHAGLSLEAVNLYRVLLLVFFISSLKVIPSILLERKLKFEKQVIPQIVESIVFNILVVLLAWKGQGINSYTWSVLAAALIGLPIYYLISPWRISLSFSLERARKLFSFGFKYQAKSFIAVIKDDLWVFFLSGLVGTTGIGYWGFAQRWAYYPYRFLVDSITKVTFPAYSRLQENTSSLRVGIEKSLFAVSLVLFPLYGMMIVLMSRLISFIPRYEHWQPALISFYFLCFQAILAALTNILINVLDATGRVGKTLVLMVGWTISTWLISIVLVAKLGYSGISIAQFIVGLSIIVVIVMVQKVIPFSFSKQIIKPLLASLLMAASTFLILNFLPKSFLYLFVSGVIGCIIYLGTIWILSKKELVEITMQLKNIYRP